jgi:diguanylate cyclase (GGDEF)-like protein
MLDIYLTHFPKAKSRLFLLLSGFFIIIIIGILDLVTGEFPFAIFYLLPIGFITWSTGRQTGILASVASALIWFFDQYTSSDITRYSPIPYWNATVIFGFYLVVTFILSLLKQALENEKKSARTDYLTGAGNSRAFSEAVTSEMIKARRYKRMLTVAYIDLDNFKTVNDTMGHSAGDRLLCQTVQTIMDQIRRTDVVARLGGDEFAILLPETSSEQAKVVITKLQQVLLAVMEENNWPVTFSIGVVTFARPPATIDQLIGMADSAMFAAKNEGKNMVRLAVMDEGTEISGEFIQ